MNIFDTEIILFFNQFAKHWYVFDKVVNVISDNDLFKGGIFAVIIWWAWFRNAGSDSNKRKQIICTLIGGIIAIGFVRLLALTLPLRLRPIYDGGLNFVLPYGMTIPPFDGLSSFPSDHATLFICLAIGLLFVSRKVGIISICYTILVICIPRVYLGLHWPTDILGGLVLGLAISLLCNVYLVKSKYVESIVKWSYSQPMLFYPLLFLITYQIAELFSSSRALITSAIKLFQIAF